MNIKTTVILAVLLLAVGGYMFFTRDTGTGEPKKVEEHKLVDVASASDVTKLVITPADGKPITIEKKGADWRLTQPVDAAADQAEVTGVIDGIINLKATNEVDANSGAHTGLEKPQYVVDLTGSKSAKISFGDKLAVGNGVYTKVDGHDKVEIVDAGILEKLDKPASTYRQAKLVETPSLEIKQLTIDTQDQKLELQKQGAEWQIVSPQKMTADATAVTDLLNAVTGLKAASFVDDPSEQADAMKGNPPVTSVSFSTVAPATQPSTQATSAPAATTITFGAYDDVLKKHLYAKASNSPFIAKVDTTAVTALQKKPIDLRDKKIVDLNPDEVSRFSIATDFPATTQPTVKPAKKGEVVVARRIDAGEKGVPYVAKPSTQPATKPATAEQFELPNAKKPSPWVLADGADASENDVRDFLNALHPLRADKYLDSNPASQPTVGHYTVKLHTEAAGGAKAADVEIRFADRGGNDQPLIGEYNGLTFEVSRFTLSRFLEGDFKNKAGTPGAAAPVPSAPPLGIP